MLACIAGFLLGAAIPEAQENPGAQQIFFQAHRGALDEMPENTLAAFRFAWSIPGAVPEVDLRSTSDGALVCIHDDTPKRTTNAPPPWDTTPIREIPLHMLRKWDAGGHFGQAYVGEKVPLLDDVLTLMTQTPERQIYLDLKDVEMDALLAKIRQFKIEQRVIFVHGDVEMCKKLQALYPGARTMTWLSGLPQQQKARFEELAADGFAGISQLQFHLRHTAREPEITYTLDDAFLADAIKRARAAGVELQLRPFLFTPQSLKHLVGLGVRWFVADAPHAFHKALLEAGVPGVSGN